MARKSRSVGSAQRIPSLGHGGGNSLSKQNLEQFTLEARRQEARRRGCSTPSPEPDLHDWDDSVSSHIRQHPRNYARRDNEFPEPIILYTDPGVADGQPVNPPETGALGASPSQLNDANRARNIVTNPSGPGEAVDEGVSSGIDSKTTEENALGNTAATTQNGNNLPRDREPDVELPPQEHTDVTTDQASSQGADHRNNQWRSNGYTLHKQPKPRQTEAEKRAVEAEPRFPPNFPAYRMTQSLNEAAAYLANASYFVSLCGPPVADLKYGIIAVPVGEESLLFGPQPEHTVSQSFLDAIDDAKRDYFRAVPLHNPDEDSEEFVRYRVKDRDPGAYGESDISISEFRGIEVGNPRKEDTIADLPDERTVDQDEDVDVEMESAEMPKTQRRAVAPAPKAKAPRAAKKGTASRAAGAKPQGVAKARRSLRNGGTPAPLEEAIPAPGRRTRSGKK